MANTIRTTGFVALTTALVAARHAAKMSQRELATALGCLPATIANIEGGQRRIDVVELIALSRALGVDPTELFHTVLNNVDPEELTLNFSRSKK
jgi:transcriptional regulator with XRE-family HTH domain